MAELGVDEGRRMRQLSLLQEWRRVLGDAGYVTLVSVAPPMGLLVRDPSIEHRWIEISTNGLVIVFEKDELGRVQSEYHLLYKGESSKVGPSSRVALQAAAAYLHSA
jgi:hypothetical protein